MHLDSFVVFTLQYVVVVGLLVILELAGVVLFFIVNDEVSLHYRKIL